MPLLYGAIRTPIPKKRQIAIKIILASITDLAHTRRSDYSSCVHKRSEDWLDASHSPLIDSNESGKVIFPFLSNPKVTLDEPPCPSVANPL